MFKDFNKYMEEIENVCNELGYKKSWTEGGGYIFLEVAEFIEACRGKRGDPEDELGDALFTLLAVAKYYKIDPIKAIEKNMKKLKKRINEVN